MRYAVFFRNLNLGRAHCPRRPEFEQAFLNAGASAAASFLTNGTLAFQSTSLRTAGKVVAGAQATLAAGCGLSEPAFLRELSTLAALVATEPFRGIDRSRVFEFCVTFLPPKLVVPVNFPRTSPNGDVEIVAFSATEVLSVVHKRGKTPGSPNAFLEKALGRPATTRAWNTVVRLIDKHGT